MGQHKHNPVAKYYKEHPSQSKQGRAVLGIVEGTEDSFTPTVLSLNEDLPENDEFQELKRLTDEIMPQGQTTVKELADAQKRLTAEKINLGVKRAIRLANGDVLSDNDFYDILYSFGDGVSYWELFKQVVKNCKVTKGAFSSGLKTAYTQGYATKEEALDFFRLADNRHLLMSESDIARYNKIGDEVEVFRGCSIEEYETGDYSLSWSLSQAVAEFFAFRMEEQAHKSYEGRVVVSTIIRKEDILAVFDGRQEYEVIVLVDKGSCVNIVTDHPTDLFYLYAEHNYKVEDKVVLK